jgi:hypothetical protein
MDSMTKQRREGEANRPQRAKTGQRKLIKPSWTEFVRLADQAVVAFAGADMINRAEPRACGYSRRSRRLDTKWPETGERQLPRQTKPGRVSEGRRRTRLASSRTGENPPYGMIGEVVETSGAFEARSAPLLHPTNLLVRIWGGPRPGNGPGLLDTPCSL